MLSPYSMARNWIRSSALVVWAHFSDAAENQQNDNNKKDKPQATGRGVTPFAAMRPAGQRPNEGQDQDHDQYGSKHVFSLILHTAIHLRL